MLYDYLIENYKPAEPIFFSDIKYGEVSRSAVNQQLRRLCEKGKLTKYENGIYYLPSKSRLKSSAGINADMVARYKYVTRRGKVDGYYAGSTFANQLGISTQVPNKVEIVSNHMSANVREVLIGNRTFIVRRSVVPIDNENVYTLQLLDLLKDLDAYVDGNYDEARSKVVDYIHFHDITRDDIDRYIRKFPTVIFRYYYELRLDNVSA